MFQINRYIILLSLLSLACTQPTSKLKRDFHYITVESDSIPALSDSAFLALKSIPNDSLYILNFWAKRSQQSLENRQLLNQYSDSSFQVIQLNLDYPSALPHIKSLFKANDFYYNPSSFVLIDSSWNGLLPATLFITQDTLVFEQDVVLTPEKIIQNVSLLTP